MNSENKEFKSRETRRHAISGPSKKKAAASKLKEKQREERENIYKNKRKDEKSSERAAASDEEEKKYQELYERVSKRKKERKKSPWMHWMNLQFENLPLLSYSYTLRCVVVSHERDTRESSSSLWENVCAMCAGVAFLVVACLLLHPASQWERNWMRYLLVNLYTRAKKHRLSTYSQMKKKHEKRK